MKIRVCMKSPGVLEYATQYAVMNSNEAKDADVDHDDLQVQLQVRDEMAKCRKWFEYDEVVFLEIDTDAMTCVVVPIKK